MITWLLKHVLSCYINCLVCRNKQYCIPYTLGSKYVPLTIYHNLLHLFLVLVIYIHIPSVTSFRPFQQYDFIMIKITPL